LIRIDNFESSKFHLSESRELQNNLTFWDAEDESNNYLKDINTNNLSIKNKHDIRKNISQPRLKIPESLRLNNDLLNKSLLKLNKNDFEYYRKVSNIIYNQSSISY